MSIGQGAYSILLANSLKLIQYLGIHFGLMKIKKTAIWKNAKFFLKVSCTADYGCYGKSQICVILSQ